MTQSYNGWPASPTLATRVIQPVPGVNLRIADNQNVADIFTYLVRQYHRRVDDVTKPHPADDWGFAYRANVNNPSELSNHSSGTAIDLDATEHPNSVATAKTFSAAQIAEVHKILAELEGVIRWGGDYRSTVDAMHFEINVSPGNLREVASKIRNGNLGPKTSGRKSITQIAHEVIAGDWGNGDERISRLKKAGYNYREVQAEVQRLLK